jgi:hypothetical protein
MQSAAALVDVAVGEKDGNRLIVGSRHSRPALLDDPHLNQATGDPKELTHDAIPGRPMHNRRF